MGSRSEELVVFGVMSILVALFTWIYVRDRQPKSACWLLGWIAIFFHFAAAAVDRFGPPWPPRQVTLWINRSTLMVGGTFFLLSVAGLKRGTWKNALGAVLISLAAIVYLAAIAFQVQQSWIYVALLVASIVLAVVESFRLYGWHSWFWRCIWLALAPYIFISIVHVAHGSNPDDVRVGMDLYLFSVFAVTGLLFLREFHRLTPGVIFTSLSFLSWGTVFPLDAFLHSHGIVVSDVMWDLPKYFVAFGMILVLFENQAEVASTVARQFQGLFENNLAAVYVCTLDGKLLDCNTAFLNMYGFSSKQEALEGSAISEYSEPEERGTFLETLNRDGKVLNYECRHRRKDGRPFWILERATIVTDSFGRRAVEGTAIDITERKQAEIALRQSEERFATIFRQSPVGCAIISVEGFFVSVNENLLRMLRRSPEDVIGKTSVDLGLFASAAERRKFFERLRAHGSVSNVEITFKDAAGNLHEALYFANPVCVGDKQCIFAMLLDQTDQRELERKFLQAQKMDALGRLAGGVAHDFNNLLGVIGGYAELLQNKVGSDENCRRYCMKILDTTERAGALTRQLLTFGRKEVIRPMPLRPDEAIGELNSILPRLLGEDIELLLDLRSTRTLVMDKTHFEQVILNIVVNSRDAMPSGGRLFIESDDLSRPALSNDGSVCTADYVAIHIRDTGSGMDAETLAHAFEPFYTTKERGRGTGLGLATVYSIVEQCKGEISIQSEPGRGTRVSILLAAVSEPEPVTASSMFGPVQKGTGTILVVEDEPELRNSNAEFLISIGYSVICASSGAEALQISAGADRIDLVISDVVMPKMSGREFADRFLELHPDTKVLFVSGYADDVVLRTGISLQRTPFLQKPFSLRQLGATVSELLAADRVS